MGIPREHLLIGQVFHEDDDSITLKIPKDMSAKITLGEAEVPDAFFTIVFMRRNDDGSASTWIPWQT